MYKVNNSFKRSELYISQSHQSLQFGQECTKTTVGPRFIFTKVKTTVHDFKVSCFSTLGCLLNLLLRNKECIQCCSYQNHQDPLYVVNWHFSTMCPVLTDVKSAAMLFFKYSVNRYQGGFKINKPLPNQIHRIFMHKYSI